MARPRIYVNRFGKPVKEVTGAHFNKGRGRFYVTLPGGKLQEFRTWDDARAAFATAQANALPADELARIAALARYRSDLARHKLQTDNQYQAILGEATINSPIVVTGQTHAEAVVGFAETANALGDQLGVPRMRVESDTMTLPTGPHLRDVIERWKMHKSSGMQDITQHQRAVERYWAEFVRQVGNVFVAQLHP